MRNDFEIGEIDGGHEAPPGELAGLNDLWNETDREIHPDDPPRPLDELVAEFHSSAPWRRSAFWAVRREGRLVASAELWWRTRDENRHRAWCWVEALPGQRRQGLGTALLRPLAERAPAEGLTLLRTSALPGSPGEAFLKSLGFSPSIERGKDEPLLERESRLAVEGLDRGMLDVWVSRARERASEYRLEFWSGPTPEDKVEEFARLTHVMNTAPAEEGYEDEEDSPGQTAEQEQRRARAGFTFWTLSARHMPSGELAGYTRIFPSSWRREFAYQDDTGVVPAHRNRGLGRWLKAAMLTKLLEERPETRWVSTWNADSNEPMLNINVALGFRPCHVYAQYEIETQVLQRRLG